MASSFLLIHINIVRNIFVTEHQILTRYGSNKYSTEGCGVFMDRNIMQNPLKWTKVHMYLNKYCIMKYPEHGMKETDNARVL